MVSTITKYSTSFDVSESFYNHQIIKSFYTIVSRIKLVVWLGSTTQSYTTSISKILVAADGLVKSGIANNQRTHVGRHHGSA